MPEPPIDIALLCHIVGGRRLAGFPDPNPEHRQPASQPEDLFVLLIVADVQDRVTAKVSADLREDRRFRQRARRDDVHNVIAEDEASPLERSHRSRDRPQRFVSRRVRSESRSAIGVTCPRCFEFQLILTISL